MGVSNYHTLILQSKYLRKLSPLPKVWFVVANLKVAISTYICQVDINFCSYVS